MPMVCLELKKAGDFDISHSVREVRFKDDQQRLLKVLASNVNPFEGLFIVSLIVETRAKMVMS